MALRVSYIMFFAMLPFAWSLQSANREKEMIKRQLYVAKDDGQSNGMGNMDANMTTSVLDTACLDACCSTHSEAKYTGFTNYVTLQAMCHGVRGGSWSCLTTHGKISYYESDCGKCALHCYGCDDLSQPCRTVDLYEPPAGTFTCEDLIYPNGPDDFDPNNWCARKSYGAFPSNAGLACGKTCIGPPTPSPPTPQPTPLPPPPTPVPPTPQPPVLPDVTEIATGFLCNSKSDCLSDCGVRSLAECYALASVDSQCYQNGRFIMLGSGNDYCRCATDSCANPSEHTERHSYYTIYEVAVPQQEEPTSIAGGMCPHEVIVDGGHPIEIKMQTDFYVSDTCPCPEGEEITDPVDCAAAACYFHEEWNVMKSDNQWPHHVKGCTKRTGPIDYGFWFNKDPTGACDAHGWVKPVCKVGR